MLTIQLLLMSALSATLLAMLCLLTALMWANQQKPARLRVRVRRERTVFPPQSDDTHPAHAGFDKRVSTRGPPVPTPPLQTDQPRHLQASDSSDT